MPETGKYLLDNLPKEVIKNVHIIVTGSMFPWTVLGTDAPLNLGAAIGLLLNAEDRGVHICMHAKIFNPHDVKKIRKN